jgi:hypothetical protein
MEDDIKNKQNKDNLKKNNLKKENDLKKNIKKENDLKNKQKTLIGCDIIVN